MYGKKNNNDSAGWIVVNALGQRVEGTDTHSSFADATKEIRRMCAAISRAARTPINARGLFFAVRA